MVNTKITPRKDPKCPMCPYRTSDPEAMRAHLVTCGLDKMEKRLSCEDCSYVTEKQSNLTRHKKAHHSIGQIMKEQVSLIDQDTEQVKVRDERLKDSCDSKEDWEKADPGDLDDIIGASCSQISSEDESADHLEKEDLKQIDPTVRKLTCPIPVFNPMKKLMSAKDRLTTKLKIAPSVFRPKVIQLIKADEPSSEPKKVKTSATMISTVVQTDPIKSRHTVWKTSRCQEDGRDIEIVEMKEYEEYGKEKKTQEPRTQEEFHLKTN